MKYLKKIFEADFRKLLDVVHSYNDILKNDATWIQYCKNIEDWSNVDILEEVIKFAQNRIEEKKQEFQKDMDFVKDLYLNYIGDECNSFSDYSINRVSHEDLGTIGYQMKLKLVFSSEVLKKRKFYQPSGYKITCDEVLDYWKQIWEFFSVLKSYDYVPRIEFYQMSGAEMTIIISKK
jgi:hypothetical protein